MHVGIYGEKSNRAQEPNKRMLFCAEEDLETEPAQRNQNLGGKLCQGFSLS